MFDFPHGASRLYGAPLFLRIFLLLLFTQRVYH